MLNPMKSESSLHPVFLEDDVRGLVFDLDGTLIDSATDILQGMRLTFEQMGLGTLPNDYFPDNLHGTCEGIVRSIMIDMDWPIPSDFKAVELQYTNNYATLQHKSTHLYEHVRDILTACRDAGLPMAICTNKGYASAVTALHKVELYELFDFVSGADTWGQAKPSPLPLQETIRMIGIEPEHCLYFGDTSVDAICARDAGVRFILHESGYGDQALRDLPQHFSFQRWNELQDVVEAI